MKRTCLSFLPPNFLQFGCNLAINVPPVSESEESVLLSEQNWRSRIRLAGIEAKPPLPVHKKACAMSGWSFRNESNPQDCLRLGNFPWPLPPLIGTLIDPLFGNRQDLLVVPLDSGLDSLVPLYRPEVIERRRR